MYFRAFFWILLFRSCHGTKSIQSLGPRLKNWIALMTQRTAKNDMIFLNDELLSMYVVLVFFVWSLLIQCFFLQNIRVMSKYYTYISIKRLAELLELTEDVISNLLLMDVYFIDVLILQQVEDSLSALVVSKTVYAKIDRPKGIVTFKVPRDPSAVLQGWSSEAKWVYCKSYSKLISRCVCFQWITAKCGPSFTYDPKRDEPCSGLEHSCGFHKIWTITFNEFKQLLFVHGVHRWISIYKYIYIQRKRDGYIFVIRKVRQVLD